MLAAKMASRRMRTSLWVSCLAGLGLVLGPATFILGHRNPPTRRPLTALHAENGIPGMPEKSKAMFLSNEEIKYTEVRVIGEAVSEDDSTEEEMSEVLLISDALARARDKGLDLVLISENRDPPTVKIVSLSKYTYQQKKMMKVRQRKGKMPKIKEVKISYTIGDHDLNTKLAQAKKWLDNPRQQVKVTVQMRGRTRMFETQARDLLKRILFQVAEFGKAAGTPRTPDEAVVKDRAGNLFITLRSGEDVRLLKLLAEDKDEDEEDEDEAADAAPQEKNDEPMSEELKDLQEELEEIRQDLLYSGIKPGKLNQQPEFLDVMQRIREAKDRAAMGATMGRSLNPVPAASLPLAAGTLVAALTLRPRSQAR